MAGDVSPVASTELLLFIGTYHRGVYIYSCGSRGSHKIFFSCRNIQIRVFHANIFKSECFMQKYWSGTVTRYPVMRGWLFRYTAQNQYCFKPIYWTIYWKNLTGYYAKNLFNYISTWSMLNISFPRQWQHLDGLGKMYMKEKGHGCNVYSFSGSIDQ